MVDLFLYLCACLETVSLQFYQHLFFHEMTILLSLLIILLFEDDMIVPQLLEIVVQLLLLLLHTLMMHLIEILLLEQFLVCPTSLLSHNNRLIQLFLQTTNLVLQLLILLVLSRNLFHSLDEETLLDEFVPLLLEVVQSLRHFVLYEEISEVQVDGLTLGVYL